MTEQQYKELCKQVRHYQLAKGKGKKKAKPVLKPRGKVEMHQKPIGIEETPTDLDEIQGEPFSLTPNNVSEIWTKVGKERIKCVNTGLCKSVAAAAVYRLFL